MATSNGHGDDYEVARKIEQLTVQLSLLSKEVASLKGKAPAVPGSRPGARIA
jgi:hypothetical protein